MSVVDSALICTMTVCFSFEAYEMEQRAAAGKNFLL